MEKNFGDKVQIYAIDINPECEKFKENNITIFIGSQSDPEFLKQLMKIMPPLDIIIDDGGHIMEQQKVSFKHLYDKVKDGGIYLVEDTHTSYWYEFHGGLKNPDSFIEYSKNLIDALYNEHVQDKLKVTINDITQNINSISFYDSIIVFEKKLRHKPFHVQKGKETIIPYIDKNLKKVTLTLKIKRILFGKK